MNLSDEQYELLDRYLDDDLSDAEAVGLEARLKVDAELAGELAKLREHRSMRAAAFTAMEPGDVESQQLQWYLRGALHQQSRVATQSAPLRMTSWVRGLSRLAAVLAIGIGVGYFARGTSPVTGITNPTVVNNSNPTGLDLQAEGPAMFVSGERPIAGFGASYNGGGTIQPVTTAPNAQPVAYEVSLRDVAGNVVARRQFRTFPEAREFVNELSRLQQKQRLLQNSGVRLIGDGF